MATTGRSPNSAPSNGSTCRGSVAGNVLKREGAWLKLQLSSDAEETFDEPRLPRRVSAVQPFHLPLSHHVHGLNTFRRPLRGVKRAEALHRPPPPSDRPVVLFDDVVEVLHPSQLAVRGKDF